MVATRYVIKKMIYDHYLATADEVMWTAYIGKAKTFKTEAEAENKLKTLPEDFYQIDRVFKVKH